MLLTSLLLATLAFAPAGPPHPATQGFIQADAISPDKACKPGAICASKTLKNANFNGCFFNNFFNKNVGGTPLAIDVTETGAAGSPVYIYWVNNTNQSIGIKSQAKAKYYCV